MSETRVGLVVEGVDKASAMLGAIGKTGKSALDGVRKSGAGVGGMLKAVGESTTALNQGLEIGKKAVEAFRAVVLETVSAAFEFRKANDPAVKQLKEFSGSLEVLRARVGDVMIPILQGFADGLRPVVNELVGFVNANREIIATGFADWLASVGDVLITVVAKGVLLVSRAWSGWLEIINVVDAAVSAYFELLVSGIAGALKHVGWLASAFNNDLGAAINNAAGQADMLAATFGESADESMANVERLVAGQNEFEEQLGSVETTARRVLGDTVASLYRRAAESEEGLTRKTADETAKRQEMLKVAMQGRLDAIDALSRRQIQQHQFELELSESQTRQQLAAADELKTTQLAIAQAVADSWASAFQQIVLGQEDAGVAVIKAVLSSARTVITTAAAVAAAQAGSFAAALGPLAIGAAAAAAFGIVIGMLDRLPKAARGGLIGGGTPGRDSVGVLTQRGEGVLQTGQTAVLMRLADALERQERMGSRTGGSSQPMTGRGSNVTQVINVTSAGAVASADVARAARDGLRLQRRAIARGF